MITVTSMPDHGRPPACMVCVRKEPKSAHNNDKANFYFYHVWEINDKIVVR